ncbi:MAG: prepilin-type N-terminal cleavage/methylation domain-containing protein [Candidatus Omnitrophica bacterium]|nr:prepilin-type N-terminal cleavage/methylation domain-containing protein [Candidatus Omnitrophota bacterium]MBU4149013.1 prepilin-type N-terminal cleavage/methylation domain-containing protein [Candidatus Omnitrophota bacterium]
MRKVYKGISSQATSHKPQVKTCALVHLCTCALKRGFSLLELIIAIGVLAVGLVGVLQIFPVGLRASQRAGMITKAAFLAQNKIEEIKMTGFDSITALPPKIPLAGEDNDFEWEIAINELDLNGLDNNDDIRKVTVTVSWLDRSKKMSKDFITYVAR